MESSYISGTQNENIYNFILADFALNEASVIVFRNYCAFLVVFFSIFYPGIFLYESSNKIQLNVRSV